MIGKFTPRKNFFNQPRGVEPFAWSGGETCCLGLHLPYFFSLPVVIREKALCKLDQNLLNTVELRK